MLSRFNISQHFAKTAATVILGNGLTAILGFIALRVYTELTPPDVYGVANLLLGTLSLGIQCCIQPVTATQLRYHTQALADGKGDAFTAEAMKVAIAGAVCLAVAAVALILYSLGPRLSNATAVALSAALWIILNATRQTFTARLQSEQRMQSYIAVRLLELVVTIVSTSLLLWFLEPHPASFILGQIAGFLAAWTWIASIAPWPSFRLLKQTGVQAGFLQHLVKYGTPFVPLAVLYWLSSLADRYVLAALMGTAAAGKYFAAFIIAAAGFGIINGMMGDLFRPKLFAAENAGHRDQAQRVFLAWLASYLALSFCILVGILLLGDLIVLLAIAAPYRDGAVILLAWISCGFALSGLATAFENRLLSYGRSNKLLLPVTAGAVANVLLSYLLITWNGVQGAAQSSSASFAVQLLFTAFIVKRAAAAREASSCVAETPLQA